MFKDLTTDPSSAGEPDAATQRLLDHLTDFAFYDSLSTSCADQSFSLDAAVEASDGKAVVQSLLGPKGLGYATAPKGLILFHRYPEGARTALEEQIREGFAYLASSEEPCRYHFTVTESHQQDFEEQVNLKRRSLEAELKTSIEVDFSTQSPATDTIALDLSDRLVRTTNGNLLLRPAGHGALLSNLQGLDADIVWIKNIDNVAHQRFHPLSIHWKRVLAGSRGPPAGGRSDSALV